MCCPRDPALLPFRLVPRSTPSLPQPVKPTLPCKLIISARINLNNHWDELEELMAPARMLLVDSDNAIIEKMVNELRQDRLSIGGQMPVKPTLPRKLTSSACINLNNHCDDLEKLMAPARMLLVDSDNANNENLVNELRLARLSIGG